MGVSTAHCAVCMCALMQVLLLPVGRGFTGPCLTCGAHDGYVAMGGACLPFELALDPEPGVSGGVAGGQR